MFKKYWQHELRLWLSRRPPDARLAIIGLGNPLRGDDRAGLAAAERLCELQPSRSGLLVLPAGQEPANILGEMRRFEPEAILFLDAMHLSRPVGAIAWLDMDETEGISASTHSYPLAMLSRYLQTEYNCAIGLIGIQPAQVCVDTPLSPRVVAAVELLATELARQLEPAATTALP